MAQAKAGDKVLVHYTGTLEDGSIFDTSEGFVEEGEKSDCSDEGCGCGSRPTGPLEFTIGEGRLIPKFEEAVKGLEPGQSIKVTIAAVDAYGERADEMVANIGRSDLPEGFVPEVGNQMEVILQDDTPLPVLITEVNADSITLDANHPLAGCDLTFDIRLVEIL